MSFGVYPLQNDAVNAFLPGITLYFQKSSEGNCELQRVHFSGHPQCAEIVSVRGKTGGAYKNTGSFQWTPGVKGVVLVLIKALLRHLNNIDSCMPVLEGTRGSLAASLDYALDRQPEWLFDMFGKEEDGNAYLRRLLLRSNPGMRLPGPVGISLNEQLLPARSIKVYFSETPVRHTEELNRLIDTISRSSTKTKVVEALCTCRTDLAGAGNLPPGSTFALSDSSLFEIELSGSEQ